MMKDLKKAWHWFVKALFPVKCLICYREGEFLCQKHQNFKLINTDFLELGCLSKVKSVADYQDPVVKKTVETFKFRGVTDLGEFIATKIEEEHRDFLENAILVPIPLHWSRKLWRGFNQSEVLAQEISRKIPSTKVANLLKRVKKTKQQAKLSKNERTKNTQNAFVLTKNFAKFSEQKIVLIDDVFTSGATLISAGNTLQKAGYKNINALVFAHHGEKFF